MKTAISIPDELFNSADDLAERMGVSRSELYARAVAEFLAKHRDTDVTDRLNEVYASEAYGLPSAMRAARSKSLRDSEWS